MSDKDKAKGPEDKDTATPAVVDASTPTAPAAPDKADTDKIDREKTGSEKAGPDKTNPNAGKAASDTKSANGTSAISEQTLREKNERAKKQADTPAGGGGGAGQRPPKQKRGGGWKILLWLLLILALAAGIVVGLRWLQEELDARFAQQDEQNEQASTQVASLQNELSSAQQRIASLSQTLEQLRRQQQNESPQERQLREQLAELQKSLSYQRNRIQELATVTREDWLLAEAEYLLKLANQRLLIERSTEAAQSLLQEADRIIRELDDPQLMPVRRALAKDLTQLRLAESVDLEGLYLRLASLAESVPQLPTMKHREISPQQSQAQESQDATEEEPGPWWRQVWNAVENTLQDFGSYIRIRDHVQRPEPLLPPDAAQYLQQNLRFMLERAQLAAMREEPKIYRESLENVVEWARRYYPETQALDNFLAQVNELAQVDVQQELPDISQSLQLLKVYADRFHKLNGAQAPAEDQSASQSATQSSTKEAEQ
jgi:uroporphyrin-3 C-methyltransferase